MLRTSRLDVLAAWRISGAYHRSLGGPLEGFAFKCPEESSCVAPHGGALKCSKLSEGVQTLSVSVQGLGCNVKRSPEKSHTSELVA